MTASISSAIQSGSLLPPADQGQMISQGQPSQSHPRSEPLQAFYNDDDLAPSPPEKDDLTSEPQMLTEEQFQQQYQQQFQQQYGMDPQMMQQQYEYEQFMQQQQQQYEQEILFQQQLNSGPIEWPDQLDPSVQDPAVLSQSHLKPGHKATLLSYTQTLELYRQNAKKTNDPELQFEFAAFMIDAGKSLEDDKTRTELFDEAMKLLRRLASNGHAESQHYLAECYASGFAKGKPDFDKAFPLWVQASKHGHPDAAYRTGRCYDEGLGTRKDSARAVQFYRYAFLFTFKE